MPRTTLLPLLALLLALPRLHGADTASAPQADEHLTTHTDARWGRVLFIRNDAAQPTPADVARRPVHTAAPAGPLFNRADLARPEWTNAVATARDFLLRHGRTFAGGGTFDPDADLAPLRAERDALGMTHVRFTQTYRGLPVFGADATVHLAADGRVSSTGARLVPDIQVDVQPALTRDAAVTLAVAMWHTQFHRTETPEATSTNLCLLAPGLLHNDGNPAAHLVWEVKLLLKCEETARPVSAEDYYFDAQTGELREQMSEGQNLDRLICDCSQPEPPGNRSSCPIRTINGYNYGRRETNGPVGPNPYYLPGEMSLDVDTLFDKLGDIHQFYQTHFGRNGASNQGGTGDGYYYPSRTYGLAYSDFGPGITCPNAVNYRGTLQFCKDMVVDDVVAHEYAHAVVLHCFYSDGLAVGMTGTGEPGALNESHSDVMGEMFELAKTAGCDWIGSAKTKWGISVIGRVLFDPPSTSNTWYPSGLPDRFYSTLFYCGSGDNGGRHLNSTVPTKAAYLLSRGGFFNGCTINALGEAKVEQIVYRAVTQYYAQTETFNGAYAKWIQAATDLYGAGSDEVRQTTRALQAVELDQPGYCSGIPAQPPAAADVPPGPLTVTPAGPDLVLSWPPVPWLAGEPVLLSTTNLTTGPWTALTTPLATNTVTVPNTGVEQYFRLRIP